MSKNNLCKAAVKYTTLKNAYLDIEKNYEVYLVKEEIIDLDNVKTVKTFAYTRCRKTVIEQNDYCHLHQRMISFPNKCIKIYERDIVPNPKSNDTTKWIATVDDIFFEKMGKRGCTKKNADEKYNFTEKTNPILFVLTHKNPKLQNQLILYATELLKNNNFSISSMENLEVEKEIEKEKTMDKKNNKKDNLNDLLDMIPKDNNDDNNDNNKKVIHLEDIYNTNSINQNISFIELKTNDDKVVWYNQENNNVYEYNKSKNTYEIMGILREISKDYCKIKYNGKLYTILLEINKNKKKIFCCVLTDSLFDENLNLIGTRSLSTNSLSKNSLSKNSKYIFNYI
jgi:hypothetical protein